MSKNPLHPATALHVVILSTLLVGILMFLLREAEAPAWAFIGVGLAVFGLVLGFLIPRWPGSKRP
ncbi:hypothetical protein [Micromonospora okii]|uniref:hypothetical protein n=1 Tax=Micromonospora okii TaxID=1182970 RepID=UPI001E4CBE10|nr:hypothetical protein [Micromonospora okii]